jgi:imidazolonepropionase-like amidohydrolase
MRRKKHTRWSLLVPLLAGAPALAGAQSMALQTESGTWAITNARIETVTKGTIDKGTIVIRDGLIESVGANVTPPRDARVVDYSGKTVYPGFIDLTSSMGLPAEAGRGGRGGRGGGGAPAAESDSGPRNVGLEPERVIADEARPDAAAVKAARDHGIVAALVAPDRGLFRGQSALLPMRDTADTWVIKSPVAINVGYQGVPGEYPGTLLGVIAYQRQSLYDAQRYAMIMERYKTNPRGMQRVNYDPALEALVPVVKGDLPLFVAASEENEIRRALALGKEFNVKVTLVGAMEGFEALDALKGARPPVVTVDFPQPTQVTRWDYHYVTREGFEQDSAARIADVRKEIEGNAAKLNAAGIQFALASGGLAPQAFMDNVKKAIAAGLSRQTALEALTIRPAEIAGVDQQLGSIEAGKIADLVVMDGDALTDSGRIRSVVVDGLSYDVTPTPPGGRGGRGGRGGANSPIHR